MNDAPAQLEAQQLILTRHELHQMLMELYATRVYRQANDDGSTAD